MKSRVILFLAAALVLGAPLPVRAQGTEYKATPVTISRDRVRNNGKLYYSHVVLERQTLFSIAKAYGVSIQDIYDSNPTLKLETEGLKTYQILLIPVTDNVPAEEPAKVSQPAPAPQATAASAPQGGDYVVHTVKWYEDLNSIARKYGVSKEAIMRANGLTSPTVSRKQKLLIPTGVQEPYIAEETPAPVHEEPEAEVEDDGKQKSIFETIGEAISEKAEEFLYTGKKDVTAALIMPFNASKSPSDNNLEFYSGVLLAAHDLKAEGVNVDLSVSLPATLSSAPSPPPTWPAQSGSALRPLPSYLRSSPRPSNWPEHTTTSSRHPVHLKTRARISSIGSQRITVPATG